MNKNMGGTDRIIRQLAAAILVILFSTGILKGTFGWVALAVAGIFVLTSLVSFCPLYALLGISTCKKPHA